ncbi:MAG: T9SS type A sorting domain-containing protein [Bacteroidetes bacterium]|nr:T9SS type A sorting domain-containing protein [Bacteroidota bacterium]MBL6944711.1 T9SS type A sorting domain-containing protein [Bacteroidales bacterium]
MKTIKLIIVFFTLLTLGFGTNRAVNNKIKSGDNVDTKIDNQGYWRQAAKKGLVDYNPDIEVATAIFTGSSISAKSVFTINSPDIAVTEINSTQSENSVFVNPLDETNLLNSNNSTNSSVDTAYGANALFSFNSGTTWDGDIEGAGADNAGDPAATIGLNGRWYVNFINSSWGLGVSYSDDQGETWTTRQAAPNPGIITDKNHMWIDNSSISPYEGNLYVVWTNFGGPYEGEIGFSYSTDDGETWTVNSNISSDVNAGSHNQGVNLSTGPNGELYAVWAIYDSWPSGGSDEVAIGMAMSLDGGNTWNQAKRIITNIRGIRATMTNKNMRVNSFPVATVDDSNGADKGAIYVTWANIGTPGINYGNNIDVYVIKSVDNGTTWSNPLKVNSDVGGRGKQHFFPWITCDPTNGILSMIYYDDRNVDSSQCEVYCANSVDGGSTWEEFKVSDVSFTPAPIPGMADKYMGDYLGIHSKNGVVYPVWTDNRMGYAMSFCSPYETNPLNRPTNLSGDVDFDSGTVNLIWTYEDTEGFLKFIIYRDGDSISSTTDTIFTEILPQYGLYNYRVTAYYSGNVESGASGLPLQWGDVVISVNPDSISNHLSIGIQSDNQIVIINEGQLDLEYSINLQPTEAILGYCAASGGGGEGNEFISGVDVGDIYNINTESDNYTDYYNLSTTMVVGENYDITVTNGEPHDLDQCGVWIDWNGDEVFDNGEQTLMKSIQATGKYTGTISPPPGAVSGTTKMRVRITYTGALQPCGTTTFGEVEDYSVVVQGWLNVYPLYGLILPGDTNFITVNFNTINLSEGLYTTNAVISSNDPFNSIIELPLSLQADYIIVDALVDLSEVCSGQIVQLMAQVSGLFDTLSYVWSSQPEGFNSTMARPLAMPFVSTWFKAEILDGEHNSTDSVYVKVITSPEIILGSDTSLCSSITWILNAGHSGSSYLWSTGDTTQTITVDTFGTGFGAQSISVEVLDTLGCTGYDEINIEFVNCSGINQHNILNFSVYPNPNNGEFHIRTGNTNNNNYELKIFDITGVIVYKNYNLQASETGGLYVNAGSLKDGVYTILLVCNGQEYAKKFVLKN